MDILYNVEEKYLQATEELNYGELPKALHLFRAIIDIEPEHARAHYQLGYIYCYEFKDYMAAGFHFKQCIELDPVFPDVYTHYIKLLITLNMHKTIRPTAGKALQVPGVCESEIHNLLGNYAEKMQDLSAAKQHYQKAASTAIDTNEHKEAQEHLERIASKQSAKGRIVYIYSG